MRRVVLVSVLFLGGVLLWSQPASACEDEIDYTGTLSADLSVVNASVPCNTNDPATRKFRSALEREALARLAANRTRLQGIEEAYRTRLGAADDPEWTSLRTLIAYDQALAARQQLAEQLEGEMLEMDRRRAIAINAGSGPPRRTLPQIVASGRYRDAIAALGVPDSVLRQRTSLGNYLQTVRNTRVQLREVTPALAFLDTNRIEPNASNASVFAKMREGFADAYGAIDDVSNDVRGGDFPLQEMAPVIAATLERSELSVGDRAAVDRWLRCERRVDSVIRWGTTIVATGLGVGALFASGGTAIVLGLAGAAVGLPGAAFEVGRATDLYRAARAEQGGGSEIVGVDVSRARLDVILAGVDVGLSILDVGLSVRALRGLRLVPKGATAPLPAQQTTVAIVGDNPGLVPVGRSVPPRGLSELPIRPGQPLGTGLYKVAYEVPGDPDRVVIVFKTIRGQDPADLLRAEQAALETLASRGFPVAAIDDVGTINGNVAFTMPRYAAGNRFKDVNEAGRFMQTVNGDTLDDIARIERMLEDSDVGVHDLQFLIDRNGRAVINDPLAAPRWSDLAEGDARRLRAGQRADLEAMRAHTELAIRMREQGRSASEFLGAIDEANRVNLR